MIVLTVTSSISSLVSRSWWSRFGGLVLAGPKLVPYFVALGGVQGQIGIVEVGSGHHGQVGSTGSQHGVGVVDTQNRTH